MSPRLKGKWTLYSDEAPGGSFSTSSPMTVSVLAFDLKKSQKLQTVKPDTATFSTHHSGFSCSSLWTLAFWLSWDRCFKGGLNLFVPLLRRELSNCFPTLDLTPSKRSNCSGVNLT